MPKCTPCLSSEAKKVLRMAFPDDQGLSRGLRNLASCPDETVIEACGGKGSRRSLGEKRKAGPYALFMGTCLREKRGQADAPSNMKECAAEWRRRRA